MREHTKDEPIVVDSQQPDDTGRDQGAERGVHHKCPEEEESGGINKNGQQDKADYYFVLSLSFYFIYGELSAKPRQNINRQMNNHGEEEERKPNRQCQGVLQEDHEGV